MRAIFVFTYIMYPCEQVRKYGVGVMLARFPSINIDHDESEGRVYAEEICISFPSIRAVESTNQKQSLSTSYDDIK